MAEQLTAVRKSGVLHLRPRRQDLSPSATRAIDRVSIEATVLSTQHEAQIRSKTCSTTSSSQVIRPVLERTELDASKAQLFINPAGPRDRRADGRRRLTGRKIIIDTYGGASRHGGGVGRRTSKVDRSAAYFHALGREARRRQGLARRAELQVAYAIGRAHPVGLYVETFGTETVPLERIEAAVREVFDLRPAAIIRDLDLIRPIYAKTSAYGHFGRELPRVQGGHAVGGGAARGPPGSRSHEPGGCCCAIALGGGATVTSNRANPPAVARSRRCCSTCAAAARPSLRLRGSGRARR